jgi:hypothetical protein
MPPKQATSKSARNADPKGALEQLGVFTKLKPGELAREVHRQFEVPGSFWGDECKAEEWDTLFRAQVTEVEMTHNPPAPVVRFQRCASF